MPPGRVAGAAGAAAVGARPPVLATTLALLVLGAVLLAMVVLFTPWHPSDAPAADRVAAAPARDFTAAERAREDAYHAALRPPAYGGLALSLAVALVLGLTPLGARLVTASGRPLGGGWVAQAVVGGLVLLLLGRLLTLPLSAWAQAVRSDYGLATQTWAGWLGDVAKSFAISSIVTVVGLLAVVGLARALPRWWWAVAAAGGAALVVVLSFGYPVIVEPLFNRFTPMPASPLRTELLALAERDGVPVRDVLVADASRRTTTLNAYVSGFGATRRIVVYDTLLDAAPDAEVEQVVAHELGHAAERDVLVGTAIGAVAVAAGACALGLLLSWPALLTRAGAGGAGDPRVVALVLALAAIGGFVAAPASALVSRHIEARADAHALDLTRDPTTFAELQRRLALRGLTDLDPSWFDYTWFASHPTPPQRIAMARTWARQHGVEVPGGLAPTSP